MSTREKYELDRGPERLPLYASLYRFGESSPSAPLLTYVGGAVGRDEYLARKATDPERVVAELGRAFEEARLASLAALICPCPIGTEGEGIDGRAPRT